MSLTISTIYTCCLGGSDAPISIHNIRSEFPATKFIAFVDSISYEAFVNAGWDTFLLDHVCQSYFLTSSQSVRLKSRIPKLNPYSVGLGNQYALWVDANVLFTVESLRSILNFLERSNSFHISCFRHPKRSRLFLEILHCYIFGKLSFKSLFASIQLNLPFLFVNHTIFSGVILLNLSSSHQVNQSFRISF